MIKLNYNKINMLSTEFKNKLTLCYLCKDDNDIFFEYIYRSILEKKSLEKIAYEYLILSNYNGQCKTSIICGFFDAYYKYINNKEYNSLDALYLNSRVCNIGQYELLDVNGEFKIIFINIKDLIYELDGKNFFDWLNELAKQDKKNIL